MRHPLPNTLTAPLPRNALDRVRLLLAFAAVLPFYTVLAAHFLLHPDATGFIQYDQPYYVANGRAIFERGNGWAYPNPYDPDPGSPVIYAHWLPWVFGFAVKYLGVDPALPPLAIGLAAGIAYSWLTLRIIERLLPSGRLVIPLFFLAMWGGGLLCAGGWLLNGDSQRTLLDRLFAYDLTHGWWFLNWGRNLMYPTESVYHAIVAAAWLAMLRGHDGRALAGGALLASTHPFSGLQLLLFIGGWCIYRLAMLRNRQAAMRLVIWLLMFLAFSWYYGVYLPRFPQHEALQRHWVSNKEATVLSWTTLALAYGPVALLALWRLTTESRPWKPEIVLFGGCAIVTFLLMKHEWLLSTPIQPIHFSHGYEWMPLFLLGLPKLQQLLIGVAERLVLAARIAALALLFGLGTLDNLVFIVASWTDPLPGPLYLSAADREMLDWIDRERLNGVLLCLNRDVCYLSATYTPLRPYAGHPNNTPEFSRRMEQINAFFFSTVDPPPDLDEIDYLLLPAPSPGAVRDSLLQRFLPAEWKLLRENEGCLLMSRVRSPGGR